MMWKFLPVRLMTMDWISQAEYKIILMRVLLLITPAHQSPLGVALSLARRHQILEWADRSQAWIIEDDYDSEFRYHGKPLPR